MSMFRFLPGILIIQAATALLVVVVLDNPAINWLPYGALALIASFLAAFWFASIAHHIRKDALARLKEETVREREQLLASAEKEKSRLVEQTHKRIVKETKRAHAKASFKVGAVLVGAVAAGLGLLSLQFMTVGLLVMATAGGTLTGYLFGTRRKALGGRKKTNTLIPTRRQHGELIEGEITGPSPRT